MYGMTTRALFALTACGLALVGGRARADDKVIQVRPDHQCLVVKDAGLWPNLLRLSTGRLVMTGFNQPSHTLTPGDADCWGSTDGGRTWQPRGTVAQRTDPTSNRVHFAVGLTSKGHLLA